MRYVAGPTRILVCLLLFVVWGRSATAQGVGRFDAGYGAATCQTALTQRMPFRPRVAMTGSAFAQYVDGMSERQRERAILEQIRQGNVPTFLRTLQPVRLQHPFEQHESGTVVICVMPDYMAIGSDDDFLRVPMTLPTATVLAAQFGFILPTSKMVDAIYAQARHRLRPKPMPPGPQMRSTAYFQTHNRSIDAQWQARGVRLGTLVAGHKKDVVITNRLSHRPGRVAIYGWHRSVGRPIQPLSMVHGARYADYSHGVRLVSDTVWVNGQPRSVYDVLRHPRLAWLLSSEGAIVHLPYDHFASTVLQQRKPRW